jgi:hypothetical protein
VSNLSTIPQGLLGLFGIKNEGKYPTQLNASYSPTLDVLQWLAGSNARELISEQCVAFNSVGLKGTATNSLRVPSGQCWLLHGAMTSYPTLVTEFVRFCVGLSRLQAGNRYLLRSGDIVATNNPDGAAVGSAFSALPGPLLMFPDDEISFVCHKLTTAGTIAPFLSAWVYRFPL